jgi:hypothetical protein
VSIQNPIYLVFLLVCISSCTTINNLTVQSYIPTNSKVAQLPIKRVLVINTYNTTAENLRKNKEELYAVIMDRLLVEMSNEICTRPGFETVVISGITNTGSSRLEHDSTIMNMMDHSRATHAIALTYFDVYFHQTDVEVTNSGDSKQREAFYDIIATINYSFYDEKGNSMEIEKQLSRFHSSRYVISGFFALGPNVVKNSKDVYALAYDNMVEYLDDLFPKGKKCQRLLFTAKEFVNVGKAVSQKDYHRAMIESQRFLNNQDLRLAAKANYNCAVLLEMRNLFSDAKFHLAESLNLFPLPEAKLMMNDYKYTQ